MGERDGEINMKRFRDRWEERGKRSKERGAAKRALAVIAINVIKAGI
jgi:hypothetical protein